MATFKVTFTVNTNSDVRPNWIQSSITEQLEEGEQLISYECELLDEEVDL